MPDWTQSMEQQFEYYVVDPKTWKDTKQLRSVTKCTISRDSTADTLGSATFDLTENIGECYVRVYLITIQNGVKEKHVLGTFLVQSPSEAFNGTIKNVSVDAYTPLLELKENQPPIGYYVPKNENVMENAYIIARERMRPPIVSANCDKTLYSDFVSNTSDTWLSFISDLVNYAKYAIDLDEMGRIIFTPQQTMSSMQPVFDYRDDNCSILLPDITCNRDLYGIPNVVEVIYSSSQLYFSTRVVNDDSNSDTSTIARGREIVHRVTNPEMSGSPSEDALQEYAEQLLESLSSIQYTMSYTHAYNPVRVGDCIRMNYKRAGITNIKALVTSQTITCTPGCSVKETVVFTDKLWRRFK